MASVTTQERTDILELVAGMFNAAPGATYLNEFTDAFVALNKDLGALAAALGQTGAFKSVYPSYLTAQEFANKFLGNLGLKDNAEAQDFVQAKVNAGEDHASVIFQALAAIEASTAADFQVAHDQLTNKAAVAEFASVTLGLSSDDLGVLQGMLASVSADPSSVQTAKNALAVADTANIYLTQGQDRVVGTAGNDTIIGLQSTLGDMDTINGGGGFDTLKAIVSGIIAPTISNVEHLQFQAQHRTTDSGDNNLADEGIVKVDFNTNVTNVTGFTTIENSNSRADLIIEDVRIANHQVTKDITIAMRETDPGNVDYGVYFDQNSLRSISSADSTVRLEVIDTRATVDGKDPLLNSPYRGFQFTATDANGVEQIVKLESDAIDDAQTYDDLVAAFQVAADNFFGPGVMTVSKGAPFAATDTTTGLKVAGVQVNLTASGSYIFSTPEGSGWIANGVVPANSGLHTNFSSGGNISTELVTSKIILDDVGRGSTGGDLVVGGLSVGETSTSKGVQRFEITVEDNSKLQTINSTNNTLQEVVIVNGTTSRVDNAYNENQKNAGSLTVLGFQEPNNGVFNNTLPGLDGTNHGTFGFTDVRLIDASAMTGKLDISAQITARSINKYLNLLDTTANPAADNITFAYSGGSNDDNISVVVDGQFLASHTLTGREDFRLNVSGGAGNDTITVDVGTNGFNAENGQWRVDHFALRNVNIDAGQGNDTINAVGTGQFNIIAGAGDDTVYVDNTGGKAVWVVAAQNDQVSNLQSAANAVRSQFLYKGQVVVTFAASQQSGLTAAVAAAWDNGFEAVADIPTGDNYSVSQYRINQAIKTAINDDAVLSKLLVAEDGPGTSLIITSKIDGSVVAGDLQIAVVRADGADNLTTISASEQAAVLEAYKNFSGNSEATIAMAEAAEAASVAASNAVTGVGATVVGTDDAGAAFLGSGSSAHNDSTINAGPGTDVVVLSTGAYSNNVVKFTGYSQGETTIVNFNATGVGADRLDFSAYLTSKQSASGSSHSQSTIATSVNTDATVEANSVTVLDLVYNPAKAAATFENLTAQNLLAAINSTNTGAVDYANITAGTLNALNTYTTSGAGTTLVAGEGKAVVLVHNASNHGQYKAFELTFDGSATNTSGNFSNASLIGTFDLGHALAPADVAAAVLSNRQNANEGPNVPVNPVNPVNPGTPATDVTVLDLTTHDASNGAFNFVLDYATAGVKLATINGFGADDTIQINGAPAGSGLQLASSSATGLDFVYGLPNFSNVWGVTLGQLDANLVTDVMAAPDLAAQVGVLDADWGNDWLDIV